MSPETKTRLGPVPTALETERLRLRRMVVGDLARFQQFLTDPEATRFMSFAAEDKTAAGAQRILDATIASYDNEEPLFALAIEERASGDFVGCCGLSPLTGDEVEIFYVVFACHRSRGIATETTRRLIEHAFVEAGIGSIVAMIVPDHRSSIAVARRLGFRDRGLVDHAGFGQRVSRYVLDRKGDR